MYAAYGKVGEGKEKEPKFQWMPEAKVKKWLGKKCWLIANKDGWFGQRTNKDGGFEYKVYIDEYKRPDEIAMESPVSFQEFMDTLYHRGDGSAS